MDAERIRSRHPKPKWLAKLRRVAQARLATLSPPDGSEENWRFLDTKRLSTEGLDMTSPIDLPKTHQDRAATFLESFDDAAAVITTTETEVEIVHCDSNVVADLVSIERSSAGDLIDADDYFSNLNSAHFVGGAAVSIPDGQRITKPIVIVHCIDTIGRLRFPRTRIDVGNDAEATVVEAIVSTGPDRGSLAAAVSEINVGDNARLSYAALNLVSDESRLLASIYGRVGRDAQLVSSIANLGAAIGRIAVDIRLAAPGADYSAYGVYVGDGDRNVDSRTIQHHSAPNTSSRLLYNGAVLGKSRSIYAGVIRIDPNAAKSSATQASHYLILSDDAEAASIPNLEIFNHDVTCGHSSSGGPPDPDQLYYLESRGIAPDVAERLLIDGFFRDAIDSFPDATVRKLVSNEVERRLRMARKQVAA